MDREQVLLHQTVLVAGGRIAALGSAGKVSVPAGAVRINGRGQFLLPGLNDMHVHVTRPVKDGLTPEDRLLLWVANGVTTVRNMDFYDRDTMILHWRAQAAAGQAVYPRIYTTGAWPKSGVPVLLNRVANDVADYKAAGYDFVKIHDEKNRTLLDSILVAAKRVGIPVVGHVPLTIHIEHVLPLGYKSIEHSLLDYWTDRKAARHENIGEWLSADGMRDTVGVRTLISSMRKAGIWHDPTQTLFERVASWEPERWGSIAHDANNGYWYTNRPNLLKIELDSGINLLAGTDQSPWRGALTRELQALVHAGLTPYQALRTATVNPAVFFGTEHEVGTVAVGRRADLVLLTGNPLRDVRYTAQPAGVMLGGRWFSRAELTGRIAHLAAVRQAQTSSGDTSQMSFTSYWANVANEFEAPVTVLIGDQDAAIKAKYLATLQHLRAAFLTEQLARLERFRAGQRPRWRVLVDSLGESDAYAANTQRLLALAARELAEIREVLPPDQHAEYDAQVAAWVAARRAEGYAIVVPKGQP